MAAAGENSWADPELWPLRDILPPPTTALSSNSAFGLLVESLTDYAVFMIDPSGTIASWNPGVKLCWDTMPMNSSAFPSRRFSRPKMLPRNQPAQELERAMTTGRSDDKRMHIRKDGTPLSGRRRRHGDPGRGRNGPGLLQSDARRQCAASGVRGAAPERGTISAAGGEHPRLCDLSARRLTASSRAGRRRPSG